MNRYEKEAHDFVTAIQWLAHNQDGLDNLESYLSYHFGEWLERYANTPSGITSELLEFSKILKLGDWSVRNDAYF